MRRLSFAVLMLLSVQVEARNLTNLELYSRCYAHLTGQPLPVSHPLKASLENESVQAVTACRSLLSEGLLNPANDQISGSLESKLVFRQLYHVHRSWFKALTFQQMETGQAVVGDMDMNDANEPALALNYILFSQAAKIKNYSQLLTDNVGYLSIRSLDATENQRFSAGLPYPNLPSRVDKTLTIAGSIPDPNMRASEKSEPQLSIKTTSNYRASPNDGSGSQVLTFTPVTVGELNGVTVDTRSTLIPNYAPMIRFRELGNFGSGVLNEAATTTAGMLVNFNLFEHRGGGVLGQVSFMKINWGHEPGRLMDGAQKLPRRWIQKAMESMLCKEFPVVRETDATPYVVNPGTAGTSPFRKSASCAQCHATLDQMAQLARNNVMSVTDWPSMKGWLDANSKRVKIAHLLGRFTPSIPSNYEWASEAIVDFHKTMPKGKAYFRTFSGQLVNQPLNTLSELGTLLSSTDDFYQCAAKRYLEYFTGLHVRLYDRGDSRYAKTQALLSPREIELRKYVENVGAQLKQHQSLRQLIEEILSSKYYKDSDYNPRIGAP